MNTKQLKKRLLKAESKSIIICFLLSIVFIGLGQAYNKEYFKAAAFVFICWLLWIAGIGWLMYFVSIGDALFTTYSNNKALRIELTS